MRKTVLLLATMALSVLLASGVAWAANVQGTGGDDVLTGTTSRDVIGDTAHADREDTVVDCKAVYDYPTTPYL